ncbi:MAG: efflux RND transporter periplasmic adaptor subunit, partial [Leptospirales bacterium]|nr:efflux RND transporter periplasmic adaptor subunit [Leptospirales bacterium]
LVIVVAIIFFSKSDTVEIRVKPERGEVIEAVYALGTVKTDKLYNARFGMNTMIRKLYVQEGDFVTKGTALVLGDTFYPLTAPFSGVVTEVNYLENEMATPGQTILTVSSTTDLYVRISLDQESILAIRKGQSAELSFENLRDEKIYGTVSSVYLSGDEFIVRIVSEKFPDGILPQMTCDSAITIKKIEDALLIPSSAVKNGKVDVIRKGKRMTIPVKVKKIDARKTEVLDDSILIDDEIIVEKSKDSKK